MDHIFPKLTLIFRYAKKYTRTFIFSGFCVCLSYLTSLLLPLTLQQMIDQIMIEKRTEHLPPILCAYVFLLSTSILSNYFHHKTWQTLYNNYVVDIKKSIFNKILNARATEMNAFSSGDVMNRIEYDSDQFIHAIFKNIFHFINSLLFCISIILIISSIDLFLACFILFATILPIIALHFFTPLTEKYSKEHKRTYGFFTGFLLEIFGNIDSIRRWNAKPFFDKKISTTLLKFISLGNRIKRTDLIVEKIIYALNLATSIVVYYIAVTLVNENRMSVGEFIATITFIALLHKKLNWLLRLSLDWNVRKSSIERVAEILSIPQEDNAGSTIDRINSIEINHVTFGFLNEPVLDDVSFSINTGDRIAVVGVSGAGKTTLFGLILQLYSPQCGAIYFNQASAATLSKKSIRERCCVVSQEIILFDTSIRHNLTLGVDIADDKIWNILDIVGLRQTIEALPQKLDFVFSRFGDLSSGQKQRLLIARAILKDADIYFLDEATSAIDTANEQKLNDYLIETGLLKTAVVISHRYEAIKHCSKVLVLNKGKAEAFERMENIRNVSQTFNMLFPIDEQ